MKEVLERMVMQFGYQGIINGKPVISTGGMSALEEAFEVLGWDDPHKLPEEGNTCEIDGCMEGIASGMRWDVFYLHLCSKHSSMAFKKEPLPEIKQYAINREVTRDKITGFLPNNS
jgi:hypothetical protein